MGLIKRMKILCWFPWTFSSDEGRTVEDLQLGENRKVSGWILFEFEFKFVIQIFLEYQNIQIFYYHHFPRIHTVE